jgi:hypothetical protein
LVAVIICIEGEGEGVALFAFVGVGVSAFVGVGVGALVGVGVGVGVFVGDWVGVGVGVGVGTTVDELFEEPFVADVNNDQLADPSGLLPEVWLPVGAAVPFAP